MTRNKRFLSVLSAAAVVAFALAAVVGISTISAQMATTSPPPDRIGGTDCGIGGRTCTNGTVALINVGTQRGDGSAAATLAARNTSDGGTGNYDLDYSTIAGAPANTRISVNTVGSAGLFSTYVRRDASRNAENIIRPDADEVLLYVADQDAVRRTPIEVAGSAPLTAGTDSNINVTPMFMTTSGMATVLPIIDAQNTTNILSDGTALLNDIQIFGRDASNNITSFSTNPTGVIITRDSSNNVTNVRINFTTPNWSGSQTPILRWNTPAGNSFVTVRVSGGAGATAYVRLPETRRGSGDFVGRVQLVANDTYNSTIYDYELSAVTATIELTATVRTSNGGRQNTRVQLFDASRAILKLPVNPSSRIRLTYRDLTDFNTASGDVFTNRIIETRVDADAPAVAISSPASDASINNGRPLFEGTVRDSGSGLDPGSLRLLINNTNNTGNNGDNRTNQALNVTSQVMDGEFQRTLANTTANGTSAPGNLRILGGTENPTNGLYASGNLPQVGARTSVNWRYQPSQETANQLLYFSSDRNQVDSINQYITYAYDLAGNVGFSDADPTRGYGATGSALVDNWDRSNPGNAFQNGAISIDFAPPQLIDTDNPESNLRVLTGFRGASSDVRLLGATQTGLSWSASTGQLVPDRRTIAVVFNDTVTGADAGDFTVRFSTSGATQPTVTGVSFVPNPQANIINNTWYMGTESANVLRFLQQTLFITLDRDIPASDRPTVMVGAGVQDTAGNSINASNNNEPALDGIGPRLEVSTSGGTGSGTGANGPTSLTRNDITISITTDEGSGNRPDVRFYRNGGTDGTGGSSTAQAISTNANPRPGGGALLASSDTANNTFRYTFTRRGRPGGQDGRYCVRVVAQDAAGNSTSRGSNDCSSDSAIRITWDTVAPYWDNQRLTLAGDTTLANELRPRLQIPLKEAVQAGSFEVQVDGTDQADNTISTTDNQVFVFQPANNLTFGENYVVRYRATDLAGNQSSFMTTVLNQDQPSPRRDVPPMFTVQVRERTPFRLQLSAGWNLVSLPSTPINNSVQDVFGDTSEVTSVSSFDASNFRTAGMRTARRSSTTGRFGGDLGEIRAGASYWVFSDTFVNVDVLLQGPASSSDDSAAPAPPVIPTVAGYNFVGVVDATLQSTQRLTNAQLDTGRTQQQYFEGVNVTRVYAYDTVRGRFVAIPSASNLSYGQGLIAYVVPNAAGRTGVITP